MVKYIENVDLMTLKNGDFFEVINGRWYGRKIIKDGKHYIQMDKDDFRLINNDNTITSLNIVILEKNEQPRWMPF